MPELPEVETMVRGLRPALVGRRLALARVIDTPMLRGCSASEFAHRLVGSQVLGVERRGKWVSIALDRDRGMIVIQPRMTGGFWLVPPPRDEHVRLILGTDGAPGTVWFCDARRLGRIEWFPDAEAAGAACARSQGPDALVIAPDDLIARLGRTRRPVKAALMDQKVLAGIGNIYADEVLHASGIHPSRVAAKLSKAERLRIHGAIRPILETAIAAEGSSFDAGYRTVLGLEGGFLAQNAIHRRAGQPCHGCGGPVLKTRIAGLIGRPTYLCVTCQPLRPRRKAP
jgi:formamidopyrimidine-DNA glycosylase